MNNKIVKEIRKVIKEKYPKLETDNPKAYKSLIKRIKKQYKNTPWNERQKIKIV